MKKLIATLMIVSMLAGCGQPAVITTMDGKTQKYPTYGFLNQSTNKSDKVCYEYSVGNVVWSVIGFGTVVIPVYIVGFSLFNPVSAKTDKGCGIDARN
jgi:uncharacterized protein YceK